MHSPARLQIVAQLYVVESADFLFLMREVGLTFGNLSSHMSKLESVGYVEIVKEYVGKKPHTSLRLTSKGRAAFEDYRRNMRQLFEDLPG
jgi:DNA-binding MarR family transcriptional regulator